MKVVVLQSNYVPWRGYFDLIAKADTFVFYDEVQYTKNDWRNRNQVASENGKHWITIPTSSNSVNKKISEVTLDFNLEWRKSHQSLVQFCYKKCPQYKLQLKPFMDHFLFEYETNSLSSLNKYIIKFLCKEACINTSFLDSKDYVLQEGKVDRLISLLSEVGATTYLSGPAAKDYLEGSEELFSNQAISLEYFNYPNYPPYGPARDNYANYLSILDFLAFENIKDLKEYL